MGEDDSREKLVQRKRSLRSVARSQRDAIPADLRRVWSEQACAAVITWLRSRQPAVQSIMIYVPFRSELNTSGLIEWGWESGVSVIAPRCLRHDRSMELYLIRGWEELSVGAYGIPEPDPLRAAPCGKSFVPDAVVVPGLAFDRQGGRLGYGGGYYDRFRQRLSEISAAAGRTPPPWIGLGYESQICRSVPMDGHDARLEALATENGVVTIQPDAVDKPD